MNTKAQTKSYREFWSDVQFTIPLADKFGIQFGISNTRTNTPDKFSRFSTFSQFSSVLALNYYHSARWRFSLFSGYFYDTHIPSIEQRAYPEIRLSAQALYYIHKISYILITRTRLEYRIYDDVAGELQQVPRFRQHIGYTKPFNSKYIRSGTYYGILSDEVFLNFPTHPSKLYVFDRNMLTLGLGYAINDDIQVDIDYTFMNVLTNTGGEQYKYILQLNISINNPFLNLKNKMDKKKELQN